MGGGSAWPFRDCPEPGTSRPAVPGCAGLPRATPCRDKGDTMWKTRWFVIAALVSGCTADEDAEAKFVGSWAYAAGSTARIDCGPGMQFAVPFDTIVETFAEANGLLAKSDSQGCTGLE